MDGADAPVVIVTRDEARAKGLNRYYTGKPCLRGHLSERSTYLGECLECRTYMERVAGVRPRAEFLAEAAAKRAAKEAANQARSEERARVRAERAAALEAQRAESRALREAERSAQRAALTAERAAKYRAEAQEKAERRAAEREAQQQERARRQEATRLAAAQRHAERAEAQAKAAAPARQGVRRKAARAPVVPMVAMMRGLKPPLQKPAKLPEPRMRSSNAILAREI